MVLRIGLADDGIMTPVTERSEQGRSREWRDRRLARGDDRRIAGVGSGIAEYFDIDPTLVRLGLVVLLIVTFGMSLLAYFVLWLVLPTSDGVSIVQGGEREPPTLMVVIGLVSVVLLAGEIGDHGLSVGLSVLNGGAVLPMVLIAAGVVLLSQRSLRAQPTAGGAAPVVESEAPEVDPDDLGTPRGVESTDDSFDATSGVTATPTLSAESDGSGSGRAKPHFKSNNEPTPPKPKNTTKPPKTPGLITPVVLSLMMISAGVALSLELTDVIDVKLTTVAGTWLLLIAVGLLVSTIRGRAGGLIALGVVASLGLLAATVADPVIDDGTGSRRFTVTSLDELQDAYRLGVGELRIDLSALDLEGQTRAVDIELAIGELVVLVPVTSGLEATIETGIGQVRFVDASPGSTRSETDNGIGNELTIVDRAGDGLLLLTIRNRIGNTYVARLPRAVAVIDDPVPAAEVPSVDR